MLRHWELLIDVHPVGAARTASVSVPEGSLEVNIVVLSQLSRKLKLKKCRLMIQFSKLFGDQIAGISRQFSFSMFLV